MNIHFERLEDNDNPLPGYATQHSAGIDLAACLTRPCSLINIDGTKTEFYNRDTGGRFESKVNNIGKPQLIIKPHETILVPLGWKCEFDPQHVMKLYVRSSFGLKGLMLANGVGIIDSDYRGEIKACLYNRNSSYLVIDHGVRIVQAVLVAYSKAVIWEKNVTSTDRGEGGFGSTG